ncbi:type 1 fimbrial protein [Vibrio sp. V26_P1S5P106]|uniref:fimbrial protein n=1 Tax=unclassified Vibrio TaxID=2614977 RepID=UPI001373791F|nr:MULTISPECIES: fimbrial protein [unclassified Vibrio]NAW70377.1 type 1 fimbrial protein [Vibrio sp. V28_P6S34P95]NAX04644.1 type 1 fimbrial protein [Vibrio sp. V30_P3S12P165]NAX39784.1 type 1 fimbrial protein [Vibrio sp. V26_P1S5P106]
MKKTMISAATSLGVCSAVFLVSVPAFANNTITFNGEVTDQTCSVTVNGNDANPVVLLESVSAATLKEAGATAGQKTFSIGVTGCTAPTTDVQVSTVFVGNVVTADGNLGNTGDAKNVALQLLDNSMSPVDLTSMASLSGLTLEAGATSAVTDFGVQYISEAGGATPGSVRASLQYAVSYN